MTTRKIFISIKRKPGKDLYMLNYSSWCSSLLSSEKVGRKNRQCHVHDLDQVNHIDENTKNYSAVYIQTILVI